MLFRMKEIQLLTNEVLTELIFINKNLGVRYWGKNLEDQRTGVVTGCSLPVSFLHRKGSRSWLNPTSSLPVSTSSLPVSTSRPLWSKTGATTVQFL